MTSTATKPNPISSVSVPNIAKRFQSAVFYTLFAIGSLICSDLLLLLMGALFSAVSAPLSWLSSQYPDNSLVPTIGVPFTCVVWIFVNWIIGVQFVRQLGRLSGARRRNATVVLATIACLMIAAFAYYLSISTVSNPLAVATGANMFSKLGVTLIGFVANALALISEALRVHRSVEKNA